VQSTPEPFGPGGVHWGKRASWGERASYGSERSYNVGLTEGLYGERGPPTEMN